ncbi:hypothetical protein AB6D40_022780 [Vibrio cyclitrophicus]
MKKIVLHIGSHKTGSTSIQNIMADNYNVLVDSGVDYLKELCIWGVAHHSLGWCMQNDFVSVQQWDKRFSKEKGVILDFVDVIKKSDQNKILISTETLFPITDYSKLKYFHSLLKYDYDFEVVVYLREQSSFLYSWYSELVTAWYAKNTLPFDLFVEQCQYPVNYCEVLEKWGDIFGEDSVRVFSFKESVKGNGLVEHFFSNVLPEVPLERIVYDSAFFNVSLVPEAIEIVREYNKRGVSDEERKNKIEELLNLKNKEKSQVVIATQNALKKKYSLINKELLDRYGVNIDG